MKNKFYTTFILVVLIISGCATSTFTTGKDFNSDNISQIVKGETNTEKVKELFGEPFTKSVISADKELWIYTYSIGNSTAKNYVFTMNVETNGVYKSLSLFIKNKKVVNFIYSKSDKPSTISIN